MPHLVQILLPLYDNTGQRFSSETYGEVRADLIRQFGGLTAYTRAPAEGLWEKKSNINKDDIVIVEVMVETLDRKWWRGYCERLEALFRQDQLVIRAQGYELL